MFLSTLSLDSVKGRNETLYRSLLNLIEGERGAPQH